MNEILNITATDAITMSSMEIAGLTGKAHRHVLRDIRSMLNALKTEPAANEPKNGRVEEPKFGSFYLDAKGEARECFILPKREILILVSGYSVQMRAAIIDRVTALEAMIAHATPSANGLVTDLAAEVRNAIGGIMKGVIHKEMVETIPALVAAELASRSYLLRRGKTSGQIWTESGFPRMKVTSWFSNRLCEMGCQIEGHGRGELGNRTSKLFDPDKADLWLRNGGRRLVEAYISERKGQSALRLVGGRAA